MPAPSSPRDPRPAVTLVLLTAPALLLTALELLAPRALQLALALDHRNPAFWQFYTHAFVHASETHLASNLVGYAIAALPLYGLYEYTGRHRAFRRALGVLLLLGPVVFGVASYLSWQVVLDHALQYDRGFSGVVGALGGLLFMTVLAVIEAEQRPEHATYSALSIFLVLAASWTVVYTGTLRWILGGATLLALLVLLMTVRLGRATPVGLSDWIRENWRLTKLLAAGGFASILILLVSIPSDVTVRGNLVNVFAHAAGLLFGLILSRWSWVSVRG